MLRAQRRLHMLLKQGVHLHPTYQLHRVGLEKEVSWRAKTDLYVSCCSTRHALACRRQACARNAIYTLYCVVYIAIVDLQVNLLLI